MFKYIINIHHLRQVEETYFQHFRFAAWAAVVLLILSIVSFIHAVLPFVFGRLPDRIFNYFLEHSQNRRETVASVLRKKDLE